MTYDPTIPAAGSSLGGTRAQFVTNFAEIENVINQDHVDFNAAGEGKHAKMTIPEGTAQTTAAGEGALYTKDTNSRPTLFYRQESDGTEIQMTGPDPIVATPGATFLPGGMILQWGLVTAAATTGTTTFSPAMSALYSLTFAFQRNVGTSDLLYTGTPDGTSFSWSKGNAANQFYWMAIGTI